MAKSNENLERVLAVHGSAKIRGAIHRHLNELNDFTIALAASVEDARAHCFRHRPDVVVMRLDIFALEWAVDLYTRQSVPVVFCFVKGDDMSLCEEARQAGLIHFVELPTDCAAAWAGAATRIGDTASGAIRSSRFRRKAFAKSTAVQPAIWADLVESRVPVEDEEEKGTLDSDPTLPRKSDFGRTTAVQKVVYVEMPIEHAANRKSDAENNTEKRPDQHDPEISVIFG